MLAWNDSWSTGDARIDGEHREIVGQLNQIGDEIAAGADPTTLTHLIEVLLDYSYLHFHHEEHAMACRHCAMHSRNCALHRAFVLRLKNWLAILQERPPAASVLKEIHDGSSHWIERHIARIDSALKRAAPAA